MSGFIFIVLNNRFKLLAWRKSLAVFLIMFLLITPMLAYLSNYCLKMSLMNEEALTFELLSHETPILVKITDRVLGSLSESDLLNRIASGIFSVN